MKQQLGRYSIGVAVFIGIVLCTALGLTLYELYSQSKIVINRVIADHIVQLQQIFENIDATCEITGFDREKSAIDFLQVERFVGPRIGPLLLRYPERWKGPYLTQNPLAQGIYYAIVKMKDGYAIAPGNGVQIGNGKIIGRDLMFSPVVDIDSLLIPETGLEQDQRQLIARMKLNHLKTAPRSDENSISDEQPAA